MFKLNPVALLTLHLVLFGLAWPSLRANDKPADPQFPVVTTAATGENEEEEMPDPGEGLVIVPTVVG